MGAELPRGRTTKFSVSISSLTGHSLARWLLKLCAEAAADATSSNATDDIPSLSPSSQSSPTSPPPPSSSSSSALEKATARLLQSPGHGDHAGVVRVFHSVAFDQAIDFLFRARRTPDLNYARELLKVTNDTDSGNIISALCRTIKSSALKAVPKLHNYNSTRNKNSDTQNTHTCHNAY